MRAWRRRRAHSAARRKALRQLEESRSAYAYHGDPFVLALQNALRATQAAAGTDDELIAAEADHAVRSVVQRAAGATEEPSGTSQAAQVAPGEPRLGKYMRQLPVISLLALSVSLASAAHAEHINLQDSTIIGQQQHDATAPSIDEKRAEFARIPGGVTIVDGETYKTGRASSPQDALGQATGVYIQSRSGAEESRLSIRGSGLQRTFHQRGILLMQDGAPLNLADGSGDFQSIEPIALDHIEVMRGANAWRYGAANLGGAINFVTPTGQTAPSVQLRTEAGSFDYQRLFGAVAQDFGDWDAYLSFSDYAQDGFRDHSRQENQRYFANLGGRLNERLATRFYVSHVETDSQIPGSLTKAQLRDNPEQASLSTLTGDNKRDFTLNRVGNITTLQLDHGHSLELSSFYSEKSLWHPIYQVLDVDSEDLGARLTHRWQSGDGWRWSGGVEVLQGRNQAQNYVNVSGRRGSQVDRQVQTARSLNDLAAQRAGYRRQAEKQLQLRRYTDGLSGCFVQ